MNKIIEENFVKKFIIKDKRSRTIYELSSLVKRDQIIHRLLDFIDERYVILSDSKVSDEEFLKQIANVFDIKENCYVIADSVDDGKILPFKKAFSNMVNDCADYFIICGENVVVIKEETVLGSSAKIVLLRRGEGE